MSDKLVYAIRRGMMDEILEIFSDLHRQIEQAESLSDERRMGRQEGVSACFERIAALDLYELGPRGIHALRRVADSLGTEQEDGQ